MKKIDKRIIYYTVFIGSLLIIHFFIEPVIYNQYLKSNITQKEYMLLYYSLNMLINISIGIVSFMESRNNYGIKYVSVLLILNAIMAYFCLESFPTLAIISNVTIFFSAMFILGFGLVSIKKALYKKAVGIGYVILGFSFLIRFPLFMDFIYFLVNRYPLINATPLEGYYLGVLYYNYIIIFLMLISLNFIIKENKMLDKYVIKKENEFLK